MRRLVAVSEDFSVRVAAVGDLHLGEVDAGGWMGNGLANAAEEADVLLVAGDLTSHGRREQARAAARLLEPVRLPKVTVLGNHDYESEDEAAVREIMEAAGVRVLEAESCVLAVNGIRLGIVGAKGFGGGFRGASASDFGDPMMRAFIRHTIEAADELEKMLNALDADRKIVLLHYSPVPDTLAGERREFYPFLGNHLLADAIDRAGADLVLHGHAHTGTERGTTAAGIEVRNVAAPVLRRPYVVYPLP